MAEDVTDSEESEENEEWFLLLMNHLKRFNIENGKICTKAEEQYGLRNKGIMIGYQPPNGDDQYESLSRVPYYIRQ
jgi:hypothetical protein